MPSRPKKSDNLEIRLPHATKQAFMSRCRENGRSASETVREMIDDYLARPASLTSPERLSMLKSRAALPAAFAATAALTVGVIAATATHARPDLRQIFRSLDGDGNGSVTLAEFTASGHADHLMGTAPKSSTQPARVPLHRAPDRGGAAPQPGGASKLFAEADVDRNGSVSFAEFESHHVTMGEQAFSSLDADRDGRVTGAEFTAAGKKAQPAMAAHLLGAFTRLDADADGAVTRAEFARH